MSEISTGNILTILSVLFGFIIQYVMLVKSFSERITRIETKQEMSQEQYNRDIDQVFKMIRVIENKYCDISHKELQV